MRELCTCGAQLVPDSLFCHKCGRPLRDLPEVEPQPVPPHAEFPPPAPPPPAPHSAPLNFRNPVAVRVAFLMALIATLLSWIPLMNILLWGAAGFFAVYLYRQRTGAPLNIRAGVSLGWITGVMTFVLTTVMFTVTTIPAAKSGGITEMLRAQFKNSSDPNVQEALRIISSPSGMVAFLLGSLFMMFVFITLLSMAGGALGAKMVGRGESS